MKQNLLQFHFLLKSFKVKKASKTPGKEVIASISKNDIRKIAEDKINDLNTDNLNLLKE